MSSVDPNTTPDAGSLELELDPPTVVASRRGPASPVGLRSTTLGRYVVVRPLGEGGMGQVMLAYDPKLAREVAIKRLRSARPSPESTRRLVREAHAMAQLSHPNVVAIYDVIDERDEVMIAMELVDGETLTRWLERRPDWREVVRVLGLAGEGLAAAHSVGLVHRDFKPGNVLVATAGQVKVTDFGIAKAIGSAQSSRGSGNVVEQSIAEDLTSASTVVGTPAYMAPEQAYGEEIDPRCDQYAFGVTLWQGLVGRPPFTGEFEAVTAAKRRGPPRFPTSVRVPRRLAAAVERALAPSPADRWPSLRELLDELERVGRPRRVLQWGLAAVGTAAVLTSLALVGRGPDPCAAASTELAAAWNEPRREGITAHLAAMSSAPYVAPLTTRVLGEIDAFAAAWSEQRLDVCEAELVRGDASSTLVARRLACLSEARDGLEARLEALEGIDATMLADAGDLSIDVERVHRCADTHALMAAAEPSDDEATRRTTASLHQRLEAATATLELDRADRAIAPLRALAQEAAAVDALALRVEIELQLARAHERLGELEPAQAVLRSAAETAAELQAPELLQASAMALARVLTRAQGTPEEITLYADLALALAERAGAAPSALPEALALQATVQRTRGEPAAAAATLARALALREKRAADPAVLARAHGDYADALAAAGRTREAIEQREAALAIWTHIYGDQHPRSLDARAQLVTTQRLR